MSKDVYLFGIGIAKVPVATEFCMPSDHKRILDLLVIPIYGPTNKKVDEGVVFIFSTVECKLC